MTLDLDARLARASEIAKEAGALALHHFQNRDRLAIETKRHVTDLVSEADRAVEVLIRDGCRRHGVSVSASCAAAPSADALAERASR